jgi:hypothetical protein
MTISKEKRTELIRRCNAANDRVGAACDALDSAVANLIGAHLNAYDVYQDEDAGDDEHTAAAEAEHRFMHALIDADEAYYKARDKWSGLNDKVNEIKNTVDVASNVVRLH